MRNCAFVHFPLATRPSRPRAISCCQVAPNAQLAQNDLLVTLSQTSSRIGNDATIARLIAALEEMPAPKANNPLLVGTWRNAYTSLPSTASPIQRTVVSNASLAPNVEQVVLGEDAPTAIVNRVDLRAGLGAVLNVQAQITNISGSRCEIRFDRAWFTFRWLPTWLGGGKTDTMIRIPYPVPFKLLGDFAKGWIDTTYLSDQLRTARGNKGSVFVLVRTRPTTDLDDWED